MRLSSTCPVVDAAPRGRQARVLASEEHPHPEGRFLLEGQKRMRGGAARALRVFPFFAFRVPFPDEEG